MLEFISILTPIYVTLFWFLVLLSNSKTNQARLFLSIFMLITTGLYIGHALYFHKNFELFTWYDSIYALTSLLVYPMFYVYLRLLTVEPKLNLKLNKHFIPALAFSFIILSCTILMSVDERNEYFNYYTHAFFYVSKNSSILIILKKYVYLLSRVIFAAQIIYYTILCLKTLHLHTKNIKNLYSNINNKELIWVKTLIVVFSVTSVFSFIINIMGKEIFLAHPETLLLPSAIFSILLFLIGYSGNMQKQVIQEIDFDKKNDNIGIQSIVEADKEKITKKINEIMIHNKLFLDSDLKIWDVCMMMDIDRISLTKIIKEEFHTNFNDFVNKYRIDEANSILEINKNISLSDISKKSGFDNIQTFIKAYRKIEGISPLTKNQYID